MKTPAMLFACLVLLTSGAYLLTLCPTVPAGDSGEYIAVSCALGVAHPPGYPLYTLLGHLFTLLPFGSAAFRVNVSSSVFAIATAALLFATLRRWLDNPWAAFLGAGLFAFSTGVWRYAVVAEAFALNTLFVALLVWCLLRFDETREVRWAWAMAFALGLGLTHQHTLVLVGAPLVVALLVLGGRELWRPRVVGIGVGLFALGLLPYLYLPWASSRRLIVSWGDLTSVHGLITHLLRREYGTLQLVIGEARSSLGANLGWYFRDAAAQLLWVGLPLAAWGAWSAWREPRRSRAFVAALGAAFLLYTLVFGALSNLDLSWPLALEAQSRFWQLPNLIVCLFAARGMLDLTERIGPRSRFMLPAAAVGIVAAQLAVNYAKADASHERVADAMGRGTLESLPQDALFLVRGDTSVNAVRYLQACEGMRPDVTAVPVALLDTTWMRGVLERTHPEIRLPTGTGAIELSSLLDLNRERETFASVGVPEQIKAITDRYDLWNVGFTYWLRPKGQALDAEAYRRASEVYSRFEPPDPRRAQLRTWEAHLVEQYWKREQDRAERLSLQPVATESGRALVRLSADVSRRILDQRPDPPSESWRTLAFAWSKLRSYDPAAEPQMVQALERYLQVRPDAPDRAKVEGLLRSVPR